MYLIINPVFAQVKDPVEYVDPFIGTTGPAGDTNYGGVCPWVTVPHGMTNWTPTAAVFS